MSDLNHSSSGRYIVGQRINSTISPSLSRFKYSNSSLPMASVSYPFHRSLPRSSQGKDSSFVHSGSKNEVDYFGSTASSRSRSKIYNSNNLQHGSSQELSASSNSLQQTYKEIFEWLQKDPIRIPPTHANRYTQQLIKDGFDDLRALYEDLIEQDLLSESVYMSTGHRRRIMKEINTYRSKEKEKKRENINRISRLRSDQNSFDSTESNISGDSDITTSSSITSSSEGLPKLNQKMIEQKFRERLPSNWTCQDVLEWLCVFETFRTRSIIEEFRSYQIDGKALLKLKEVRQLKKFTTLNLPAKRRRLLENIKALRKNEKGQRIRQMIRGATFVASINSSVHYRRRPQENVIYEDDAEERLEGKNEERMEEDEEEGELVDEEEEEEEEEEEKDEYNGPYHDSQDINEENRLVTSGETFDSMASWGGKVSTILSHNFDSSNEKIYTNTQNRKSANTNSYIDDDVEHNTFQQDVNGSSHNHDPMINTSDVFLTSGRNGPFSATLSSTSSDATSTESQKKKVPVLDLTKLSAKSPLNTSNNNSLGPSYDNSNNKNNSMKSKNGSRGPCNNDNSHFQIDAEPTPRLQRETNCDQNCYNRWQFSSTDSAFEKDSNAESELEYSRYSSSRSGDNFSNNCDNYYENQSSTEFKSETEKTEKKDKMQKKKNVGFLLPKQLDTYNIYDSTSATFVSEDEKNEEREEEKEEETNEDKDSDEEIKKKEEAIRRLEEEVRREKEEKQLRKERGKKRSHNKRKISSDFKMKEKKEGGPGGFTQTGRGSKVYESKKSEIQVTAMGIIRSPRLPEGQAVGEYKEGMEDMKKRNYNTRQEEQQDNNNKDNSKIEDEIVLVEEVGKGACSHVYRAVHVPSLTVVAVKNFVMTNDSKKNQLEEELEVYLHLKYWKLPESVDFMSKTPRSPKLSKNHNHINGGLSVNESDCSYGNTNYNVDNGPCSDRNKQHHDDREKDGCSKIIGMLETYTSSNDQEVVMVLEYMDAGTLEEFMEFLNTYKCSNQMREETIAWIAYQTIQGLKEIHQRQMIHRDIKPANILLQRNQGGIRLGDFGIAKFLPGQNRDQKSASQSNPQDKMTLTSSTLKDFLTSTFTGTLLYMSPERLQGHQYSPAADIWSFGLCLLTMVERQFPISFDSFEGGIWGIIQAVSKGFRIDYDESIDNGPSESLCDLINSCLHIDPEERASAAELLRHSFFEGKQITNINRGIEKQPPEALQDYYRSIFDPSLDPYANFGEEEKNSNQDEIMRATFNQLSSEKRINLVKLMQAIEQKHDYLSDNQHLFDPDLYKNVKKSAEIWKQKTSASKTSSGTFSSNDNIDIDLTGKWARKVQELEEVLHVPRGLLKWLWKKQKVELHPDANEDRRWSTW